MGAALAAKSHSHVSLLTFSYPLVDGKGDIRED